MDKHPAVEREWYANSNNIVLVTVEDEEALLILCDEADDAGLVSACFEEPDFDNDLTAIALQPGKEASKLCEELPLLGQ